MKCGTIVEDGERIDVSCLRNHTKHACAYNYRQSSKFHLYSYKGERHVEHGVVARNSVQLQITIEPENHMYVNLVKNSRVTKHVVGRTTQGGHHGVHA